MSVASLPYIFLVLVSDCREDCISLKAFTIPFYFQKHDNIRFQVISAIENRADQLDYVLVDTHGQVDILIVSASGSIITETFASTFPTVVTYVVDTPRSQSLTTFMNNMLYAGSILNKTGLLSSFVWNHPSCFDRLLHLLNLLCT